MIIQPLSQRDPRWAEDRIGNSACLMEDWGCTICSICMALEKLRGFSASPKDAARMWTFNDRGEILWRENVFKGADFVVRGGHSDVKKIGEYANASNLAAIAEVMIFGVGKHWVYVESVEGNKLNIIDPLGGVRKKGLPGNYKLIGYALFEADKLQVPEWAEVNWNKAQSLKFFKGLEGSEMIDINDFQKILVELNKIKNVNAVPAYRMAEILGKLGLLENYN